MDIDTKLSNDYYHTASEVPLVHQGMQRLITLDWIFNSAMNSKALDWTDILSIMVINKLVLRLFKSSNIELIQSELFARYSSTILNVAVILLPN